jgi:hypothetical protein
VTTKEGTTKRLNSEPCMKPIAIPTATAAAIAR